MHATHDSTRLSLLWMGTLTHSLTCMSALIAAILIPITLVMYSVTQYELSWTVNNTCIYSWQITPTQHTDLFLYLQCLILCLVEPLGDDGGMKTLRDVEVSLFQKLANNEHVGGCTIASDVILGSGHTGYQWGGWVLNLLKKDWYTYVRTQYSSREYPKATNFCVRSIYASQVLVV